MVCVVFLSQILLACLYDDIVDKFELVNTRGGVSMDK